MEFYQVTAPHFTAAIIFSGNTAIRLTPALDFAQNLDKEEFLNYCEKRGWKYEMVEDDVGLHEEVSSW